MLPRAHELKMFQGGEEISVEPHLLCHWLVEAPSLYNAYKGKRAPASLTKTSQEDCTHAHTETHIIAILDALFPFWSDCNNYTLYFLLIKTKLKTWKVK